ncbi:MAG: RimK-like ATPgrasp N-terminal domain-containing protein, partial [Salinisphaera sp.]|nr:RimK-like ATPgrasp N-terminal domain-containing protein [Salinisphaera sp.]
MAEPILVAEYLTDWRATAPPIRIVAADDYLSDPVYARTGFHVINFCRSYRYQSTGYYC